MSAMVSHTMTLQKASDQGGAALGDIGRRFIWISTILAALSVPAVLVVNQSVESAGYLWVLLSPVTFIAVNIWLLARKTYRVDISLSFLALGAAASHTMFGVHATDLTTGVILVMTGSIIALYTTRWRREFLITYSLFIAGMALWWGRIDGGGPLNAFGMVASLTLGTYFLTNVMRVAQESTDQVGQYQAVLNQLPIAIFEDDFSSLVTELDRLRTDGVTDIRQYVTENPSEIRRLMAHINVLEANHSASELYGAERETLLGPLDAIEAEGRNFEAYVTELETIWDNRDQIDNEVLIHSDPDIVGAVKWLAKERGGANRHFVAISDISELVQARETLTELNRSKDEFVAAISHEIRTPLTAVLGFATELANSTTMADGERSDLLDLIVEQSKEMAYIVEDLLVSARADMGALAVAPSETDIATLVRETLTELGQRLRVDHPGHATAFVDPVRFRQIVRNLVTNAQRYGGKNRWIEITQDPDFTSVMVSDDGPGVPPEMAERIFDSFVTAHEPKAVTASMGLGLSVSRHLAGLMGGTLVYRAAPDGSKFILKVPTNRPAETAAPVAGTTLQTS